jgi:hypothetical protein
VLCWWRKGGPDVPWAAGQTAEAEGFGEGGKGPPTNHPPNTWCSSKVFHGWLAKEYGCLMELGWDP